MASEDTLGDELEGITVLSFEQAVAAPYCSLLLADAGARVIKIERPEGDFARGYDAGAGGESVIFGWLNRGKESLVLDLRDAADAALAQRIASRADVVLSNLAPGAMDRLGLGAARLRAENPALVTCRIAGYAEDGPLATKKAYDALVQAEAGINAVTGTPEAMARVGVSLTDLATGLHAHAAILRALLKRGRSGRGLDLSVSMFDAMADWMNMPLAQERYSGGAPARNGLGHGFVAPYGAYGCADGPVMLSIQNDREFAAFCAGVMGDAALARDPRFDRNTARHANRLALDALIDARFASLTRAEALGLLDRHGIANARLNSVADLSAHAALREATARIGAASVQIAALPVRGATRTDVPALGQHSDQIREEFA